MPSVGATWYDDCGNLAATCAVNRGISCVQCFPGPRKKGQTSTRSGPALDAPRVCGGDRRLGQFHMGRFDNLVPLLESLCEEPSDFLEHSIAFFTPRAMVHNNDTDSHRASFKNRRRSRPLSHSPLAASVARARSSCRHASRPVEPCRPPCPWPEDLKGRRDCLLYRYRTA